MKKTLITLALLAPVGASGQTPQNLPDTYSLTVTQMDVAELGKALGSMPYNEVAGLIGKLDGQVRAQQQKHNAPPPEPEKKP